MSMISLLLVAASAASAATPATVDPDVRAAIEATCFDYIALHPDLAKRRVLGDTPDERLGLRRMSKEELVELTRQGALKTPKEQWDRSCTVLDVAGDTATVRLETPWFVDSFHMGKFDDRWIIINALWYAKPR